MRGPTVGKIAACSRFFQKETEKIRFARFNGFLFGVLYYWIIKLHFLWKYTEGQDLKIIKKENKFVIKKIIVEYSRYRKI